MPSSEIYTVIQDSKGYLWFGTDNGVSRYDGYKFKNFDQQDGLSDNTVFKIFEDKDGRIWFGTLSCKLSYFRDDSICQFEYNSVLKDTLPKYAILSSFYVDNKNNVYLGLTEHGCFRISSAGKIEHFNSPIKQGQPGSSTSYIRDIDSGMFCYISIDVEGHYKDEIVLLSKDHHLKTNFKLNLKSLARSNLSAVKTKNENYYLAMSNSLVMVDKNLQETLIKHPKEIIFLFEDKHNDLWVGYYKGGAIKLGQDKSSFPFLSNVSVSSILQDHEGGYWFTTLEKGAFYVPHISVQQFSGETSLTNMPANTVCGNTEGNIFVGLQDGSIHSLSSLEYEWQGSVNFNLGSNTFQVLDFLYEPPYKVWVGAVGYINAVYPKQKFGNIEFVPLPCSRLVFNEGSIWGANHFGLSRFNGQHVIYKSLDSGPGIRVNTMLPDSFGNLWIGSVDGLWKFQDGKFLYKGDKHPLLQYEINDIKISAHGLLLATTGKGLVVMNKDSIYSIGPGEGLSAKGVNALFIDMDETVWLATTEGVSNITFNRNSSVVQNISERYGLKGLEIADITLNGKDILMAGKTGFKIIKNFNEKKTKYELPVIITGVQINYTDTERRSFYELPYNLNSIGIAYKGISYKHNRILEYKYRMAGLDSTWHTTSNLSVLYPALPPGSYLFELTVADNPDYKNKLASVGFVIHPPFWKTWWFYIMAGFILLSVITSAFFLRIRSIVNKNKLLHELNNAQHKALSSQMNPHFIFNSLNSIHNYILRNKSEESGRYLTKFAKLMRMVLNNSMEKFISIEQEIKALELFLELEAMRFKGKITYSMDVDEYFYHNNVKIPPLLLQPYVENAIWHGLMPKEGNGTVKIILKKTGENLSCIVEDDGIGRKKNSEQNSKPGRKPVGTNITEKRIGLINSVHRINIGVSTMDLQNERGIPCGTRVEIILPLIS